MKRLRAVRRWGVCVCLTTGLIACAPNVALLGQMVVESRKSECERLPALEQRNQCLRAMDSTQPEGRPPRAPFTTPAPAPEPSAEEQARRLQALCIRREGQAPLCPQ